MGLDLSRENGAVSIGWNALPKDIGAHLLHHCLLFPCRAPSPQERELATRFWFSRPLPVPLRITGPRPAPLPMRVAGKNTFVFALAEAEWFVKHLERAQVGREKRVRCRVITPKVRVTDSLEVDVVEVERVS